MSTSALLLVAIALVALSFWIGQKRAYAIGNKIGGIRNLHSLPGYYGFFTAVRVALIMLVVVLAWAAYGNKSVDDAVYNSLPVELVAQYQLEVGQTEPAATKKPATLVHLLPLVDHPLEDGRMSLLFGEIKNIANGTDNDPSHPSLEEAAAIYSEKTMEYRLVRSIVLVVAAIGGLAFALFQIVPSFRARDKFEGQLKSFLVFSSLIAILTTVGIVLSVLFESIAFFKIVPITEFLFGTEWSPQIALRADQQGSSGAFGAVPLFAGTLMISAIAMMIAVPVGLMSAIYLSEYASPKVRNFVKPVLEILAGIPTVVYGFFAALTAGPFIRDVAHSLGLMSASAESALAAGGVMGIMIIPFISSLSDDVITAVPRSLRDGSLGLGATKSETITKVVLPAALPGVVGGVLLAASRAIGETMIVVMAAGLAAHLSANPLESMATVTVQIVTLLVGDQEFDSPKTLAAFALGLMLFISTLVLNFVALHVVKKYREQYD